MFRAVEKYSAQFVILYGGVMEKGGVVYSMQKRKAVIWGTGDTAVHFLKRKGLYGGYEIIAFIDNDKKKCGKMFWNDIPIMEPDALQEMEYDTLIICSIYASEIEKQLLCEMGIHESKITTCQKIEANFCSRFVEKYKDSEDMEIQKTLSILKEGVVNVLGAYYTQKSKRNYTSVLRDTENFPYILFDGKRMYYPRDYKFERKDGQEVVEDILYEQGAESPHLYVRNDNEISNGSVIVDAGVCEGNFALRYVERAKKIYLIESDPRWMEALYKTFSDYKDKVVFCDKFLSGRDNAREISLDKLVSEKIDFLKMDIEGAEVDALLGAKTVLENSFARCAICSYHRQNDEKYISYLLEAYGYHVSHSRGYMCFPYDENIYDTLDLRRGIIYARKPKER